MNCLNHAGSPDLVVKILRAVIILLCAVSLSPATAQTPAVPEIPAFLPMVDSVPATQAMPLDGTWLINTLRKKIRIEAGRAYAVDDWLHLFVLKIDPGMVVIKDITPTGPGAYSGQDLPLAGAWNAKVQADRSLSVSVAGLLGPANYKLIPVQLDNPQWYAQEMAAAGLNPPQQSYQPSPSSYQPTPPPTYQPPPPTYQPAQPQPPAYQPPPASYQPAPAQPQPTAYQPPRPARYQPAPGPGSRAPAPAPVTDVGDDEYE